MALASLRALLPGGGAGVDEAVLTYMAEMVEDRAMGLEDLQGSLGPLLVDTGVVAEGEEGASKATEGTWTERQREGR